MNRRPKVLVFNPADNVGTATDDIPEGESFVTEADSSRAVTASEAIPFGFKVALVNIPVGGDIVKYGEVIGYGVRLIRKGELVHYHNIEGARGRGDLER